jgi:hypothetical protein
VILPRFHAHQTHAAFSLFDPSAVASLACARCDFYVPKQSSQADLITSKAGKIRMLQEIPLTDEERAAIDRASSPANAIG